MCINLGTCVICTLFIRQLSLVDLLLSSYVILWDVSERSYINYAINMPNWVASTYCSVDDACNNMVCMTPNLCENCAPHNQLWWDYQNKLGFPVNFIIPNLFPNMFTVLCSIISFPQLSGGQYKFAVYFINLLKKI